MERLRFELEAEAPGTRARAARFRTLHGEVKTPVFMPVGTRAAVRAQTPEALRESGSQVLLANTYHLLLRPGPEVFRKMGGIHRFMKWDRPVLTDSGGYQIFSLPHSRRIDEVGAEFISYVDGKKIVLTPELSVEMQMAIGSDIMMVLDQCVPSVCGYQEAKDAMELTHRWALRSLKARGDSPQSIFAIVQGACFEDLRKESARVLTELPFNGFAIGGLAVGESRQEREDFTAITAELLPKDRPRYLMGVGTPIDLLEAVHRGVDMFDCILPTAFAQQGVVFTSRGKIELRRGVYRFSEEPLDPECPCPTCQQHSRAYLHHLAKVKEILGWQLIGTHNLYFYHRLMAQMRQEIFAGTFSQFYERTRKVLAQSDPEFPKKMPKPPKPNKKEHLGDFQIQKNTSGTFSIQQKSSGEVMHSVNDPFEEARSLYIEQTFLSEKWEGTPVIWDVGLGAATNAMAAILEVENNPDRGSIRIVSFERDLDPLKLACRHAAFFPYLKHPAPHLLLESGAWKSDDGRVEWRLLQGDFLETMDQAEAPDLIFYDPFSYKTDSALWGLEAFSKIYEKCRGKKTQLVTYSASTAVRSGLLAAGFYVAKGRPMGPKEETTLALTFREKALLSTDWLCRWEKSVSKLPFGLDESLRVKTEEAIRSHPQFLS